MSIDNYKILISNLPVRQQCFTTKRETWRNAEKEIDWLADFNNKLFDNQKTLNISRQDIFDTKDSTRELILKTIYWGYTSGMRGNHFVNIMKHISTLEMTFKNLIAKSNFTANDFNELTKIFEDISGLGLSTYSKFLYFLGIKFNDNLCLILDQRLIEVFASGLYSDFKALDRINYNNGVTKYLDYLAIMSQLSFDLQTKGENIEQFLFIFGNNLRKDKISKRKIPQMWNGYCPESMMKGKKVRMRLNQWDFYESEDTKLQICVLRGIQAIILNFRGEGKFHSTPNFADEIECGEILSPQNTDRPPFNTPTEVFQTSEEIENYISSIKR
jgi:hypothetical protein